MRIVRTVKDLRREVGRWRAAGERVALVPTMGALHAGHTALVGLGGKKADRVVVSIFVNPTQFAPHEDLARYPRDEAGDVRKLAAAGADLVWAPTVEEMYPAGFATRVEPAGAALGLEADIRPHHFGGVATVCLKLFSAATPDVAVFGEKDYQQLCVIRQMVRDLDLPLAIAALRTVREKDGLALSSRNAYLTAEQRAVAPALYRTISEVAAGVRGTSSSPSPQPSPRGERGQDARHATSNVPSPPGERDRVRGLCAAALKELLSAGFTSVDYVAVRDAETLAPLAPGRPGRVLAAARLGSTRLIDNVPV